MKRILTVMLLFTALIVACKKEKPQTVAALTTTAASSITANSFTTGGNVTTDGGSPVTQRGVAWATHANPTVADSITKDGSGSGTFTSNLTGLNANTTYYIRAYATNAAGTAYGNEITVNTSQGVPTITTTAISDIQPLSAKSGGNITNDGGAAVTERGVVYGTAANPTTANYKIVSGSGTGNFSVTLSPLASQQAYYVRAYATNSFGTAYGNQLQLTAASANTVTDIDGNVYPYVTLCSKSWMAENLKVTRYKNGDPITNGLTGFTWYGATTGAYNFPGGDVAKKDSFGLLYNRYAMSDSRGVCPAGWHVPTDQEWKDIAICQGQTPAEADQSGGYGTIGTKFLEGGSSGMNIRNAGIFFISATNPRPLGFRSYAYLWSSTESNIPDYYLIRAFNWEPTDPGMTYRGVVSSGSYVVSLRCVKD